VFRETLQTVYLDYHNVVALAVHWSLCALGGFPQSDQWWHHQPQPVLNDDDDDDYRLLYDFNTFIDRSISASISELVFMNKCLGCTKLIDVVCVMDRHVV